MRPDDAVLFSGWRRGREPASEAELMARGWTGRAGRILVDTAARTTHGSVVGTAAAARALSAREVLVTSGWHARRAALLLRAASRQPVVLAATDGAEAARSHRLVHRRA
ncbi:MAG: ElyC/SanA/YdcF family protein [Gaiellaceae bacterium]